MTWLVKDAVDPGTRAAIAQQGFATLPRTVGAATCDEVFRRFQDVVAYTKDPGNAESIAAIDQALSAWIDGHPCPVVDDSVLLRAIDQDFLGYRIQAHQHFGPVARDLADGVDVPPVLRRFWESMEAVRTACDRATLPLLGERPFPGEFQSIVKVWKYLPSPGKAYLIPIHYDRSVLTTVLGTRNPRGERLVVGAAPDGTPICDVRPDGFVRPKASDFPLMFPGLNARRTVGLPPTPHAVEQLEDDIVGGLRFSLVHFLVPSHGLAVREEYVAPEP